MPSNRPSLLALLLALASPAPGWAGGNIPPQTNLNLQAAWPQWRGPQANGVAPLAQPPVRWSESQNVRSKLPLPGKGHSSPVIAGSNVCRAAAMPSGDAQRPVYDHPPGTHDDVAVTHRHQFVALADRRAGGRLACRRALREEFPREEGHETGSLASDSA